MPTNETLQALRELRFSSGLSEEDLGKLVSISELIEFEAGITIFLEGSSAQVLYLIRSGRVELCMSVPPKGCLPILTLEEGDLLGWSPTITRAEMTATAITVLETQAVKIAADKLQALCEADHDIGYEMMRRIAMALSSRLVATRLQVLDVHADVAADLPNMSKSPVARHP